MADNVNETAVEFGTPEFEARFGSADAQDTNTPGEVPQMIKDMQGKGGRKTKAAPKPSAKGKAPAKAKAEKAPKAKPAPKVDDVSWLTAKKPAMKATVQNVPMDLLDGIDGGDPVTRPFVENIRLVGILQPIRVRPTEDGRFNIIAGKRRSQAVRELGWETIPAVVEKDATANDFVQGLAENNARSNNAIEEHRMVMALIDGWKEKNGDAGANDRKAVAAIAQVTGMTTAQVKNARDLGRLLPELMTATEEGAMSPWSALRASRMPEAVQRRLVDVLNENGKVTVDDVQNERRAKQLAGVGDASASAADSDQDMFGNPEDDGADLDADDAPQDTPARTIALSNARTAIGKALTHLKGAGSLDEAQRDALALLEQALENLG